MKSKIIAFSNLEDKVLLIDEENIIYEINKSDLKPSKIKVSLGGTKKVKAPNVEIKEL